MLIIMKVNCEINGKNLIQLRDDERVALKDGWTYVIRQTGEEMGLPVEETVLMIPDRNILAIAKNE